MTELTHLLTRSLQLIAMEKALRAAIPLLRGEQQSFSEVLHANKGKSSYALDAIQEQHDQWLKVINQCEAALNLVPVSKPDVIPQLQCPVCTKDTPGTIDGVCFACHEALTGMQAVAGTVVEMPRRAR
jgi:hypothetical protein